MAFLDDHAVQDDEVGSYAGFDREEFTSRSGGKLSAVKHIKVPYFTLHCCHRQCRACLNIPLPEISRLLCMSTMYVRPPKRSKAF